jgi:hypothetical protein
MRGFMALPKCTEDDDPPFLAVRPSMADAPCWCPTTTLGHAHDAVTRV